MKRTVHSNDHIPCGYLGVLGCNGYQNTDKVICMTATGDNNFLNEGIVEGTLLFIDTNGEYYLLSTGDKILAEASPYDTIWGIGLEASDFDSTHPDRWPGKNLLGKVLMRVREELKTQK